MAVRVQKAGAQRRRPGRAVRHTFYVDRQMCGGEDFLEDFDLADFCSVLQELVPSVRVVPVQDPAERAHNPDPTRVSEPVFNEAIRRYCQR